MLLGLAGIAHDEGGAQGGLGQGLAHAVHHAAGIIGEGAAHAGQHLGMGVLQGDVEVRQQPRPSLAHVAQQFGRNAAGIKVEQAQPGQAVQGQQLVQQVGQALGRVEVAAPRGQVLGHQDQFAHPAGQQAAGLLAQVGRRHGAQRAPDGRDGAEGALVAAAFAHLEPGIGRARGEQAARRGGSRGQAQGLAHHGGPVFQLAGGQPQVHLGQVGGQILDAVAPHHTAGHGQQGAALAAAQTLHGIEDGADGLAYGRLDEAAGIDEDQTCPAHVFHAVHGHAQRAQQMLGIHTVLGTAQAQGPHRQRAGHTGARQGRGRSGCGRKGMDSHGDSLSVSVFFVITNCAIWLRRQRDRLCPAAEAPPCGTAPQERGRTGRCQARRRGRATAGPGSADCWAG